MTNTGEVCVWRFREEQTGPQKWNVDTFWFAGCGQTDESGDWFIDCSLSPDDERFKFCPYCGKPIKVEDSR